MIDAPVSGGAAGAAAGKLIILGSGPQHAYDACQDLFEGYAAQAYRFGDEAALGSKVKLINNLLCGVHIAVASEAMALAKREGINLPLLYGVITHSAGNSWAFQDRMPHVIADSLTPITALNIFVKDLGLVLDMAHSVDFTAPLTECAQCAILTECVLTEDLGASSLKIRLSAIKKECGPCGGNRQLIDCVAFEKGITPPVEKRRIAESTRRSH
ncbi:3-hydroxyisobutyrate dehydrogenase-like beta-hydroxyacid dehydrogenase [Caballeronia udeis]|uniref:3-hydroxyisobutyrate dehydrogenase-like beta-hydroxyacid dehydrogenase n=2 Tax=Caballeronia udeis TaxID=1232866 RepID=A0ABW8MTV3_9BURK